jgi:hypothetical protein
MVFSGQHVGNVVLTRMKDIVESRLDRWLRENAGYKLEHARQRKMQKQLTERPSLAMIPLSVSYSNKRQ